MTGNCLTKINSQFPFTEKLKEYAINPEWQDRDALWAFVSASSEGIGEILYERSKNFVQNVRDIDTCSLHALYSMAAEMDIDNIFNYELAYPPCLEQIMNLLSTNKSYLLTTGYLLEENCIEKLYENLGTDAATVTGLVSGQILGTPSVTGATYLEDDSNNLLIYSDGSYGVNIYITDEDYINNFMEPLIKNCLIENTRFVAYKDYEPEFTSGCVLIPGLSGANKNPYPTPEIEAEVYRISQEYIGFIDDITYDPDIVWSESTSAELIDEATHILRNIAIKSSYYRDILKDTIQRYAMIGSTRAIEKLMYEYILRSFTKQEDWRYWVAPSGYLKPKSINENFEMEQLLPTVASMVDGINPMNISVIEYWDYTEYMNISAESPLVCGITGYETVSGVSSILDLSGNILTATITGSEPIWGEGTCGYVLTGGNERYWEGIAKEYFVAISENSSAEVSGFYKNIDLSGNNLDDYCEFQADLFDMFAVSSYDRISEFNNLSGVDLQDIQKKYIGTDVSGDQPPANIKNQIYPTIAPQPFIWNLVEKVFNEFPKLIDSILFTTLTEDEVTKAQVNEFGDLIDSWKYPNQEYISYQTFYEYSTNMDYTDTENPAIDRDGPFNPDVLSAYIIDNSLDNMKQYYTHIKPDFDFEKTMPRIDWQLEVFYDKMLELEGKHIFQYAFDAYDNHFMLYKRDEDLDKTGELWMRYKNHPLPFPLFGSETIDGKCTESRYYQQLYTWGGIGLDINYIGQHCYDFGIVNNTLWVLGKARVFDGDGNIIGFKDAVIIMHMGFQETPEMLGSSQYVVIIKHPDIPRSLPGNGIREDWRNWVGTYDDSNNIIFVSTEMKTDDSIYFVFNHYNKHTHTFDISPRNNVIINNTNPVFRNGDDTFRENVFRLAISEEVVSIAYESVNSDPGGDYENSITTIDILKSTLSDAPGDYIIYEWNEILDPY
jgi:hypothetical protein